jgi:hypothetical protein
LFVGYDSASFFPLFVLLGATVPNVVAGDCSENGATQKNGQERKHSNELGGFSQLNPLIELRQFCQLNPLIELRKFCRFATHYQSNSGFSAGLVGGFGATHLGSTSTTTQSNSGFSAGSVGGFSATHLGSSSTTGTLGSNYVPRKKSNPSRWLPLASN